jgi:hypothetical protein
MNDEYEIKKSLAKIIRDEKGWRKSLAKSEGSYSRDFARDNLHRLEALREQLLGRLNSLQTRREQVMKSVVEEGNFLDHIFDGVCEQLVAEGWLSRAEPLSRYSPKVEQRIYFSTEKAAQDWNQTETA